MRSKMTNLVEMSAKHGAGSSKHPNGELILTGTDAAYIEARFHGHYEAVILGPFYKCKMQVQGYYSPCLEFGLRSRSVFPLPPK